MSKYVPKVVQDILYMVGFGGCVQNPDCAEAKEYLEAYLSDYKKYSKFTHNFMRAEAKRILTERLSELKNNRDIWQRVSEK